MIPYDELDRALARWRARAQGIVGSGPIEAAPAASASDPAAPYSAEDLGSIPQPIPGTIERTGEIDLAEIESEIESYEEED